MLYDVRLWLTSTNYEAPDIRYRASAASIEEAALLALRLSGLTYAAYVSVEVLDPLVPGTIWRTWGPVESVALQVEYSE